MNLARLRRSFFVVGQYYSSILDLGRAPYVLYGVKYIDPVSLRRNFFNTLSIYLTPYAQGCDLS